MQAMEENFGLVKLVQDVEKGNTNIGFVRSGLFPVQRPCGAKTRNGTPCKNWGLANGRCRMHGGIVGKKTEEGLRAISKAHFKHGKCSKDRVRRKLFLKICRLFPSEDKQKRGILWQFLKKMTYAELVEHRHKVVEYCTRTARKI